MFLVDDPRSEPRVLHEMTQNKMAEDAESDIEAKRRDCAGKPKLAAPSSSTVTKLSKKAPKKSNKRNKSLSEDEVERFLLPR